MSMTPPGSNTGTPQRAAQEEDDMSNSSSARRFEKQKQDGLMASSDDDEVKVKAGTADDEMLSPASSDVETDTEQATGKDTKDPAELRNPEGTPSKRSKPSRDADSGNGRSKDKERTGKGKKDQSLPESEIVARWNRTFGDVCQKETNRT